MYIETYHSQEQKLRRWEWLPLRRRRRSRRRRQKLHRWEWLPLRRRRQKLHHWEWLPLRRRRSEKKSHSRCGGCGWYFVNGDALFCRMRCFEFLVRPKKLIVAMETTMERKYIKNIEFFQNEMNVSKLPFVTARTSLQYYEDYWLTFVNYSSLDTFCFRCKASRNSQSKCR